MRTRQTSKRGLTVQAVAGTFVVLLGFSVEPEQCKGLLGFAIHRTDLTENQSYWLTGGITFPGMTASPTSSLVDFPLQRFRWGDYTAKPAHHYQYQIQAMYGKPGALVAGDSVAVDVHTEDPLSVGNGKHQVHFNRSAAASQAYVRMFGDKDPQDVPDGAAFRWLSRGLEESLIAFINRATDASYALYLSVYEFQKDDFLDALFQATQRNVHVEIVYDAIPNASGPHEANQAAIKKHQLDPFCHPRSNIPSISHNKFIVLVKNNQPLAVWTGSTNFTDGAIYGQANVGHAIEDSELAATYWKLQQNLLKDPNITDSRKEAVMLTPVPPAMDAKLGPPAEYPIFSPRSNDIALDVCAQTHARGQTTGLLHRTIRIRSQAQRRTGRRKGSISSLWPLKQSRLQRRSHPSYRQRSFRLTSTHRDKTRPVPERIIASQRRLYSHQIHLD